MHNWRMEYDARRDWWEWSFREAVDKTQGPLLQAHMREAAQVADEAVREWESRWEPKEEAQE